LLWLWYRLAATAPIRPLAWEPPYAGGAAQEMTKKKKTKKNKNIRFKMGGSGWSKSLFLIPCPLSAFSPAILGMYTLMSNKQYYDALCSGEICNTEGISSESV